MVDLKNKLSLQCRPMNKIRDNGIIIISIGFKRYFVKNYVLFSNNIIVIV